MARLEHTNEARNWFIDVSDVRRLYKEFIDSKTKRELNKLFNSSIIEAILQPIVSARTAGAEWDQIATEIARAGIHKRNGTYFNGSDIRTYVERINKREITKRTSELKFSGDVLLPEEGLDRFILRSSMFCRDEAHKICLHALHDENTEIIQSDEENNIYLLMEAVASMRIAGHPMTIEDLCEFHIKNTSEKFIRGSGDLAIALGYVSSLKCMQKTVEDLRRDAFDKEIFEKLGDSMFKVKRGAAVSKKSLKDRMIIDPNIIYMKSAYTFPADKIQATDCSEKLANFIANNKMLDALTICMTISIALINFTRISNFIEGGNAISRMIVPLLMIANKFDPIFISRFVEVNISEFNLAIEAVYNDRNWLPIFRFVCSGLVASKADKEQTLRALKELPIVWGKKFRARSHSFAQMSLERINLYPVISLKKIMEIMDVHPSGAARCIDQLEKWGIVKEMAGKTTFRSYAVVDVCAIVSRACGDLPLVPEI